MVKRMEYFKKLQCYKPSTGYIDAPVRIEEIALLQDCSDKKILGRIKFLNQSTQPIIAVFVQLSATNVAGEQIPLNKERYIYQDMRLDSGELYGNKIPIALPEDVRLFSVRLEKVVFDNGEIWDATVEKECEVYQKEINIPDDVLEKSQHELSQYMSALEYVHYFYTQSTDFWECTCGKANSNENKNCSFCGNSRSSQIEHLTQEKIDVLISDKKLELEHERQQQALIEKEKRRQKEIEDRKAEEEWEQKKQEAQKLQTLKEKRKKHNFIIFMLLTIVIAISISFGYSKWYHKTYGMNDQEYKQWENAYKKYQTQNSEALKLYLDFDGLLEGTSVNPNDNNYELLNANLYKNAREEVLYKANKLIDIKEEFPEKYKELYEWLVKTVVLYYEVGIDQTQSVYIIKDLMDQFDFIEEIDTEIDRLEDLMENEYFNPEEFKKNKKLNYKYSPRSYSYKYTKGK